MRWKTSLIIFVMVLTASFAAAAPASADPITAESAADCERGANGFVDIPDGLTGEPVRVMVVGGFMTVTLYKGYVQGLRGWAHARGATQAGDLVWMDWTRDGGHSWIQCGPFVIPHSQATKTSAAQRTNPSPTWQFRACGMLRDQPRTTKCTEPWW
ncbi:MULTISPECIES: hypothetical protein [Amycolatopsis]|uniref:hypothetical protein n=1 Tax=Amycolatopsis TaxID=1813 RepID=UPI00068F635C|nr:hypothetical protein [Amycolatopsis sp. MJM2582]